MRRSAAENWREHLVSPRAGLTGASDHSELRIWYVPNTIEAKCVSEERNVCESAAYRDLEFRAYYCVPCRYGDGTHGCPRFRSGGCVTTPFRSHFAVLWCPCQVSNQRFVIILSFALNVSYYYYAILDVGVFLWIISAVVVAWTILLGAATLMMPRVKDESDKKKNV